MHDTFPVPESLLMRAQAPEVLRSHRNDVSSQLHHDPTSILIPDADVEETLGILTHFLGRRLTRGLRARNKSEMMGTKNILYFRSIFQSHHIILSVALKRQLFRPKSLIHSHTCYPPQLLLGG